jgi:glycosyltransferase involved in cell wall biosynthesis
VGGIEEGFKPYIAAYFDRHPELREKVLFKGAITDKTELYAEYAKAKIFALTSRTEGGPPNVVGEALAHGCYMVTSAVDAAEDITDSGRCGRIFPVGNAQALAEILREICPDQALLRDGFDKATACARTHFDWEFIIKRLHHMLYGE